MLKRRTLTPPLATPGAPGGARAQDNRGLRLVPRSRVALLDPAWPTDTATRALALQVFESLYSGDEKLTPHPQMAAGHIVEESGKRWTIHLRDGLRFHDGEPVLARDCVASINRWMQRDAVGRTLA